MRRLSASTVLILLALAVPAQAAPPKIVKRHLWSTVNVCDTKRHPDTIGVRASMPGTGKRRHNMWMRFQLQQRDRETGRWRFLRRSGDTGFLKVAKHADFKSVEYGRFFPYELKAGQRFVLRGLVTFQWRRRATNRVVRREQELTSPDHNVDRADPKDFSRSRCELKGPPAE